jgi:hypothetical protein
MKLWRALFVVCSLLAPASALDRNAFRFDHYDLDFRLDPGQHRLAARGTLRLTNITAAPQRVVTLQISSSLNWRSLRSQSKALQFVSQTYTSDIDHTGLLSEALVTLPRELPPGESVELEIAYEGVILPDATRLTRLGTPPATAGHSDWDKISPAFSGVRGLGYVVWYPVAMESQDLADGNAMFAAIGRWKATHVAADAEFRFSVVRDGPAPALVMLCSGQDTPSQIAPDAATVCRYTSLRSATPSFFLGPFAKIDSPSVQIFSLSALASEISAYQQTAGITPLIQDWFGTPRTPITLVELPDRDAAPFEAGTVLATPLHARDSDLIQLVLAHQLTHAAFTSPRPWISEGLAHFAQALMREQQQGRQAALDYLGLHRAALQQSESGKSANGADNSLFLTGDETLYRSKAALVWWMLRDLIGADALKKALHAYYSADDHDQFYIEQLVRRQSARDLKWFFGAWVYSDDGLPEFHIDSVNTRAVDQSFLSAVTVANAGGAAAEVPVTARTANNDFTERLFVPAGSTAVIRFTTPAAPLEFVVNDGSVPETDTANNTYHPRTNDSKNP